MKILRKKSNLKKLIILAIVSIFVLVSFSSISIADSLGYNQRVKDRGAMVRHAADGDWAIGQKITPEVQGDGDQYILSRAELYVRRAGIPEFDLTLELRVDDPKDGDLLATQVYRKESFSGNWEWIEFVFPDQLVRDNGKWPAEVDYYLIGALPPKGLGTTFGYELGYSESDTFSKGCMVYTRDTGVSWNEVINWDLTFRTYGYYKPQLDSLPNPIQVDTPCGDPIPTINVDDYISDADTPIEDINYHLRLASTWQHHVTGVKVDVEHNDWIDFTNNIITIDYPTDPDQWGKPGEDYEPCLGPFPFDPVNTGVSLSLQIRATDPEGEVFYDMLNSDTFAYTITHFNILSPPVSLDTVVDDIDPEIQIGRSLEITATNLGSELDSVSLCYQYSPDASFERISDVEIFGHDLSSPYSWTFDFPYGEGYYGFYSIGKKDSDTEPAPADFDATCQLIEKDPPFKPQPTLDSTESFYVGIRHSFDTKLGDEIGSGTGARVYYRFNWGDGELSEWLGPYDLTQTASASHTFSGSDVYDLKVSAMIDPNGDGTLDDVVYTKSSEPLSIFVKPRIVTPEDFQEKPDDQKRELKLI